MWKHAVGRHLSSDPLLTVAKCLAHNIYFTIKTATYLFNEHLHTSTNVTLNASEYKTNIYTSYKRKKNKRFKIRDYRKLFASASRSSNHNTNKPSRDSDVIGKRCHQLLFEDINRLTDKECAYHFV